MGLLKSNTDSFLSQNQKKGVLSKSVITIRRVSSQELKSTRNQAYDYLVK